MSQWQSDLQYRQKIPNNTVPLAYLLLVLLVMSSLQCELTLQTLKSLFPFQQDGFIKRSLHRYSSYTDTESSRLHGRRVSSLLEQRTFQWPQKYFLLFNHHINFLLCMLPCMLFVIRVLHTLISCRRSFLRCTVQP